MYTIYSTTMSVCEILNLIIYLEDVPSAVISACNSPPMKTMGFFLVMMKYSVGRTTMAWMSRPQITVTVYIPSWLPMVVISSISTILPAIRNRIPIGAYLRINGCYN